MTGPLVLLVAHGSRDPRAGATVHALARAVGCRHGGRARVEWPATRPGHPATRADGAAWTVRAAFLELTEPDLADVLAGLGARSAVVVPLLLTPAYHARTDLPGVVDTARAGGASVEIAGILGPAGPADRPTELVSAMRRRLAEAGPSARADALVLAAAGSRDPEALRTVERVAAALGAATGLPCRAGYVSGAGEAVGDAVAALRAAGARTVAMASYFLAPGLLHDRAREAATESGVITVAEPIGAARAAVALVRRRVVEVTVRSLAVAA